MADDLDLQTGDPKRADDTREKRRRRREQRKESSGGDSEAKVKREESEVHSRLDRVLGRIAESRRAKGDDELADAITDDGAAMAQGIISLTRNMPMLRVPVLMVLNFVEPFLAFGRVGRILWGRFVGWRMARQATAMQAEAEAEAAANGDQPTTAAPEGMYQ